MVSQIIKGKHKQKTITFTKIMISSYTFKCITVKNYFFVLTHKCIVITVIYMRINNLSILAQGLVSFTELI